MQYLKVLLSLGTVLQIDTHTMPPGGDNPYGIGFFHKETELATEKAAIRKIDAAKSRVWKIKNPNVINPRTGMQSMDDKLHIACIECMSAKS